MKCYNPHTYEKLGFDAVLQYVHDHVISEEAKELCLEIKPMGGPERLLPELQRVREFQEILNFDDSFPIDHFYSVSSILAKLKVKGEWLNIRELARLLGWLTAVKKVRAYLHQRKEKYPELDQMINGQGFRNNLIGTIQRILTEKGTLRDDASPELASIRRQLAKTANELRATLYRILRHANENKWSLEKEITIRNDRLVIPVKADSKGRVPGFVQDVSQSGGTVFVEPTEALVYNNQMRELQFREQNEIIRILQEVSEKVRPHVEELTGFKEVMIQIDILRAKAKLSVAIKGTLPIIKPEGKKLHIREGYYPLLVLKSLKEPMDVIPVDVKLDSSYRIMVISGPNAGGKSVALKTIGLLQLMLQSGFLIPVDERSVFRLFDSFFLDIGDEQSVDNDLSTYTSHLYQWRQMGDNMNRDSLFLIDEFGSGTDPRQGGAIAEAFLERFVRQRALGVITTHYGNLKEFAEVTSGVINAAMQFDTQGLRPTYRLIDGVPGRSYAFEMAERVGVHRSILKNARRKVGEEEIGSEHLIQELERKNAKLARLVNENKRQKNNLERLVQKYENKEKNLTNQKNKILRDAKLEAQRLIKEANKKIERTIREIREKNAEKEATRKLRKTLSEAMPEVEPLPQPEEAVVEVKKTPKGPSIEVLEHEEVKENDWVKLKSSQSYGKLIEIQGKRAVVEVGDLRMTVKLNQLVKIKPPKEKKQLVSVKVVGTYETPSARFDLDVKGMRVEQALNEVDKMIDDARMSGLSLIRILHGKGNGILRDAIRTHLTNYNFVKRTYDAPIEQGGSGWTIVDLT